MSLMALSGGSGCASRATAVLEETSHRPWPLPQTRWSMFMRWHDLLFLHWPVRPETVRALIPDMLELDTFDGWCWIGVVPFHMTGVQPRYLPLRMAFPELNVRTYVKTRGRSGVWFFSLDATSWLAVRAARWLGLPYYDARISLEIERDAIRYHSTRTDNRAPPAEFDASYTPTAPAYRANPGTLDHWLTERYCLYAGKDPGEVVYGEIHHPPWPLQAAEVELRTNTMTRAAGIEIPASLPLCHFARQLEVLAWPVVPMRRAFN